MIDIVVEAGKIAAVQKAETGQGQYVVDCMGSYVSSGWIDSHVHAYAELDPYGDEIDEIGVKQGVTTIIDAGSCGADRIADLLASAREAQTNVLAYLNISRIGLTRIDECSDLAWLDRERLIDAVSQYGDRIVGLKARISRSVVGGHGLQPLAIARDMSAAVSSPLMVHIGSGPPDIREIVARLEADDVITHYLHGKTNRLFDGDGKPLQVLLAALERGVQLDVGHGTRSFAFECAAYARDHGIPLGTISTDIYRGNRLNGPVYSLAHVMSKFLNIGYTLNEVIDSVTVRPAERLRRPELASMSAGAQANLTLFKVTHEAFPLIDSNGETVTAKQMIKPVGVVVNGAYMACEIRS